jgi:predicted XRE-type DNA-binding protein
MSVAAPVAHMGSGNFLADEGVADADDFRLRTMLCGHLATIIEHSSWTRALAAERIGMTQSDISRIVNGRFDDYSISRLLKAITSLGCGVYVILGQPSDDPGFIHVEIAAEENEQEPLAASFAP